MRIFLFVLLTCGFFGGEPANAAEPAVVLVLGDSLSAAYGLDQHQGWVALLTERLHQEGLPYRVVNASVSGETTRGGNNRLPAALERWQPPVVVIELGANDGLRGLPLSEMRDNLANMIRMAQAQGARVLLIGMRLPPNYGPRYTREFHATYLELAQDYHVALVPFLLDKVSERRELMQTDNLHPTAAAQPLLLETIWPKLRPLLVKSTRAQ